MSKYSDQRLTINFLLHPLYLASRLSLVYFKRLVGWETENSHDAENGIQDYCEMETPIRNQQPQTKLYTNARVIGRTAGPLQVLQKALTFSPKPTKGKSLTIAIQHSAQTDHPALSPPCIQPDLPRQSLRMRSYVGSPVP